MICDPHKLDDRGCNGAPDWIIEIVSPSSKKVDYLLKLLKYRSCGVKEYWIVDPEKDRVIVYNLQVTKVLMSILWRILLKQGSMKNL